MPAVPRSAHSRKVGLARALSKLGHCSRSRAFELIRAGQVRLNGRICRLPEASVVLERDRIEVAGEPVAAAAPLYLMMNKPRGIVTTASDEQGRETVYSLLPPGTPWLGPVGRLDKASEGLLLLTNDSEWAARITAPESHLEKTYHVQVRGSAGPELLAAIQKGIRAGGELLRARAAEILRAGQKNAWLEIMLDEGKNRHIRRMLEALDVEVLRLVRVAIGPLALGDLKKGAVRELTGAEKRALDAAVQGHQDPS
jgi:23S rRNA pseudouridine2605 synthase